MDREVLNIARRYFPGSFESSHPSSTNANKLFDHRRAVRLLYLACHASRHGLLLSNDGTWMTPVDLLDLGLRADVVLLTGCSTGDFAAPAGNEFLDNEFLGIIRQILVVTHGRAAIVSLARVPDAAGIVFSDLVVSVLMNKNPGRPWCIPDKPLPVGEPVAWARRKLCALRSQDVRPLVSATRRALRPAHPSWWGSW